MIVQGLSRTDLHKCEGRPSRSAASTAARRLGWLALRIASAIILASPAVASEPTADQKLEQMLHDERIYAGNPDFDYMLGVVALRENANTIALHALERVVLQSPERAGAWIDLAIAHARLGETETASTLLEYVEHTFDVPPALRQAIDRARQQLLAARITGGWHGEITLVKGWDNNANSGLGIDRLALTLDGTQAEFLVSPEFQVRADTFLQLGGRIRRTWDTVMADTHGRFMVTGTARAKNYQNEKNFNIGDAGLLAAYQQPLLGGEAELVAGSQQIRLGGQTLLKIRHLQLNWGQRLAEFRSNTTCRAQGGPEYEVRSYSDRHYLDGNITWIGGQLVCSAPGNDTSLSLRMGVDEPNEIRPGGRARRSELSLVHRTALWNQFTADFSVSAARSSDAEGYSPVLDRNSRRHVDRYYANVSLYRPVAQDVDAFASLEATRQLSNIAIFDQSGRVFMLGARYRF